MQIEPLIKQIIDTIPGITWSPGTYPQNLAGITEQPAAGWNVATGDGNSPQYWDARITINIWAGTADARAAAQEAVWVAFSEVGFSAQLPAVTEILLPGQVTGYMVTLIFRGLIDTQTYWVYRI